MVVIGREDAASTGAKRYFTGEPCNSGHTSGRYVSTGKCCECQRISTNAQRAAKPDSFRAYERAGRDRNGAAKNRAAAEWRRKNSDRVKEYMRTWLLANSDAAKQKRREWVQNNRHVVNAAQGKRRAMKSNATPAWLTAEHHAQMAEIYKAASLLSNELGEPIEVDHIVPLLGETVCGLHVPWNLSLITKSENSSKGNKLIV